LEICSRFLKDNNALTNLTRKTMKYSWTERYEQAFQELKKRIMSAPILTLPSRTDGFVVTVWGVY